MANDQDKNPATGTQSDISKSQSQQQPPNQASQTQDETDRQSGQFETSQQDGADRTGDQAATGQGQSGSSPDEGLQSDTLAKPRADVEGASFSKEQGEAESGFVGSEGQQDTSSELVEDEEEDFGKDGQGAPEGK